MNDSDYYSEEAADIAESKARKAGVAMGYADRVKCSSCVNGSGPHGCTDCLNTGLDPWAFAGGIEQALNDAYAEGRKDEREAMLIEQCGEPPTSGMPGTLKENGNGSR